MLYKSTFILSIYLCIALVSVHVISNHHFCWYLSFVLLSGLLSVDSTMIPRGDGIYSVGKYHVTIPTFESCALPSLAVSVSWLFTAVVDKLL